MGAMEASRTNICMTPTCSIGASGLSWVLLLPERKREKQEVMVDEHSRECYKPFGSRGIQGVLLFCSLCLLVPAWNPSRLHILLGSTA